MPQDGICGLPAKPERYREAMRYPRAPMVFHWGRPGPRSRAQICQQPVGPGVSGGGMGKGRCRGGDWVATVSWPGPGWQPWRGRHDTGHARLDTSFAFLCSLCFLLDLSLLDSWAGIKLTMMWDMSRKEDMEVDCAGG